MVFQDKRVAFVDLYTITCGNQGFRDMYQQGYSSLLLFNTKHLWCLLEHQNHYGVDINRAQ